MILDEPDISTRPGVEPLAREIADGIRRAGADLSGESVLVYGDEIARSVAEFAAQRANGMLIPSDYLLILTCRALWASGAGQTARALLRMKGPELNIDGACSDAVFNSDFFHCLNTRPAFLRALHSSASVWSLTGPYWILDLREVFPLPETGLEMTVWRVMHILMQNLAELWESSGGRGSLGIRNMRYLSAAILGFARRSRQERRFTAEMICNCEYDLASAATARDWRLTPVVLDLDQ